MSEFRIPLKTRIAIKNAYIRGEGSLPNLSRKHRLCYATVRQWFQAENWKNLRRLYSERRDLEHALTNPDARDSTIDTKPRCTTAQELVTLYTSLLSESSDMAEHAKLMTLREQALRQAYFEAHGVFPGERQPRPAQDAEPPRIPKREPLPLIPSDSPQDNGTA